MEIEYDPVKNAANIGKHGVSFDEVATCEWEKVRYDIQKRVWPNEHRLKAIVPKHGKLYVVVFTYRGELMRIISFRRANERERKRYEKKEGD